MHRKLTSYMKELMTMARNNGRANVADNVPSIAAYRHVGESAHQQIITAMVMPITHHRHGVDARLQWPQGERCCERQLWSRAAFTPPPWLSP